MNVSLEIYRARIGRFRYSYYRSMKSSQLDSRTYSSFSTRFYTNLFILVWLVTPLIISLHTTHSGNRLYACDKEVNVYPESKQTIDTETYDLICTEINIYCEPQFSCKVYLRKPERGFKNSSLERRPKFPDK